MLAVALVPLAVGSLAEAALVNPNLITSMFVVNGDGFDHVRCIVSKTSNSWAVSSIESV